MGLGHKIKSEDKLQQIADKFVAEYPVVELLHWNGSHASDNQLDILMTTLRRNQMNHHVSVPLREARVQFQKMC